MNMFSEHQRSIVDRVLDEEEAKRTHLVVALSGAHAYGFPSPDSDFDLKAVHVEPTERWLGLNPPNPNAPRMEVIDGVEVDYGSNEIQQVLVGVLKGNGNYIERILGPHLLRTHEALSALQEITRRALSRRVMHHYRGFSRGQLREIERGPKRTAKKVLYVLRTALTGEHLLRTGRVDPNLLNLLGEYGFEAATELVAIKHQAERVPLDDTLLDAWMKRLLNLDERLQKACEDSCLPESPPNEREAESWLIELRKSNL
jgi:uncharacterized protein